ncbi:monocarboxylate transporter [Scheffersomyces coipomensis]|uniref:monocarboxylate transporter n=1 Tax=Scheffersomyces coipomensis TaxID=1788519 RepID=UPI00315C99AF
MTNNSTTVSSNHVPQRLLSLIISVFVCIASGTPYLYGVYSPQLVKQVGLTASDSATLSLAENIGSGFGGLPGGLIIDHNGPQKSILMGSICIFLGYFAIYKMYEMKWGNLLLLCISMIAMGFGSITCFFATLKAAQANFPKHRGAAGAFPVSSYGLSATLFSVVSATFFKDNTGGLLEFLSLFCGSVAFFGSFFIHIYLDHNDEEIIDDEENSSGLTNTKNGYSPIDPNDETALMNIPASSKPSNSLNPEDDEDDESVDDSQHQSIPINPPPNTAKKMERSDSLPGSFRFWGLGSRTPRSSFSSQAEDATPFLQSIRDSTVPPPPNSNSNNPFLSDDSTLNQSSTTSQQQKIQMLKSKTTPPTLTSSSSLNSLNSSTTPAATTTSKKTGPFEVIKERLTDRIFLTHYFIVSIVSGIGQAYIFTVGFVVTAQYNYDANKRDLTGLASSAATLQALQVSIISIASFSGRLFSGFLSDYLYKKYHIQRLWIVLVTIAILSVGQFVTIINVSNPHLVTLASAITGGCYGLAFGTYPAVIADSFGTRTFSTSWGLVCTGPLITLFILNKYFGWIYDANTNPEDGICYKGNGCYKGAFEVSFVLCFIVFIVTSILIYKQRKR